MKTCDFQEDLAITRGPTRSREEKALLSMIPHAVHVAPASEAADRNGVDYIVTLRRGGIILVDAKTRRQGCRRFWNTMPNGEVVPDLALEKWSVMPGGFYRTPPERAKVGWTLCTAKKTDMILYTFDPIDSRQCFLFSFQLLRIAFSRNCSGWFKQYKTDVQDSGSWQSEAVLVPAPVVQSAVALSSEAVI